MDLEEELQLIEKAKSDLHAFSELYDFYLPKMFSYAYNRLAIREIAEDVVSQTFLLAVEKIHSFDTQRNIRFSSWLYRVVHNKIIDYYRHNKRLIVSNLHESLAGQENEVDKQINLSIMQRQITLTLMQIKPRYAEIISLRFYAELSIPEIAEHLNLSPRQVSVVLHRALGAFKRAFQKAYPESEIFLTI